MKRGFAALEKAKILNLFANKLSTNHLIFLATHLSGMTVEKVAGKAQQRIGHHFKHPVGASGA